MYIGATGNEAVALPERSLAGALWLSGINRRRV